MIMTKPERRRLRHRTALFTLPSMLSNGKQPMVDVSTVLQKTLNLDGIGRLICPYFATLVSLAKICETRDASAPLDLDR